MVRFTTDRDLNDGNLTYIFKALASQIVIATSLGESRFTTSGLLMHRQVE